MPAKPRVLVLQGTLAPYRVPVFRALSVYFDRFAVAHCGHEYPSTGFEQIILRDRVLPGGWHLACPSDDSLAQFDIIVVMYDLRWIGYLSLLFKRTTAEVVLWGHGVSNKLRYGGVALGVRRAIAHRAAALLFYNQQRADAFCDGNQQLAAKSFTANNALSVANSGPTWCASSKGMLFIGRLIESKRLPFLLQCLASRSSELHPDWVLEIVGDGPLRSVLARTASTLGIADRIKFHGNVTDESELKDIFSRCYLVVHPGPVGLVVNHAFSYGLPVVTLAGMNHGPEFTYLNNDNSLLSERARFADDLVRLSWDRGFVKTLADGAYLTFLQSCQVSHMLNGFIKAISFAQMRSTKC